MSELLDAALSYLARGWSVLPAHTVRDGVCSCRCRDPDCLTRGKHPRITGYHGYEAKRATEDEVREWWRRWPDANIAVVTGAISGVVVVDADPRHGGDESLRDLHLPETLTDETGGGGEHRWYQHPGYEVRNSAGLRPGIDFRGDGGYVIAPPSHGLRQDYTWELSSPEAPAPFPPELGALLNGRETPIGDSGLPSSARPFDLSSILAGKIPHGDRDDTLTRIAGHFAGLGDDLADITLKLNGVNVAYCVSADRKTPDPLPFEDIERIAKSIWQKEQRKRDLSAAVETRLNGGGAKDLVEADRLELVREAWQTLGVGGVEDWVLVLGRKDQYLITLGDDEIPVGDNLFNYAVLRMHILNRAGQTLQVGSIKEWPKRARLLRDLVRVVRAEETRSSEQVADWITEFCEAIPPQEVAAEMRKTELEDRPTLIDGKIYLRPEALKHFVEGRTGEKMELLTIRRTLRMAGWEPSNVRSGIRIAKAWREGL